ncbi:Six-bladed beta-propeller, TolB-like [Sergentomyia squamirostris]
MYNWREVIFENLPLPEDAYIGRHPYYVPENNDILGIAHHVPSGLMITTVGRIRVGVPSTLNAFCLADYPNSRSPYLWGFPDYKKNTLKASFFKGTDFDTPYDDLVREYPDYYQSYQTEASIKKSNNEQVYKPIEDFSIISVYSPVVDSKCNRLYVVDSGIMQFTSTASLRIQNPAILVFDLPSDGCKRRRFPLLKRLEIPGHLWKNPLGFIHLTVDQSNSDSCDDTFIYIPNIFDNNLIVCNYKTSEFWSFTDPTMNPILSESKMSYKDLFAFTIPMGIMNVALGWPDNRGSRVAYYAPGSSFGQYITSTKILKDPQRSQKYNPMHFNLIGYRGCDSQSIYQIFDPTTGIIFFAEIKSARVRCWNVENAINSDTQGVIFESKERDYISDMTLDSDGYLWIITNQFPLTFLTDVQLDTREVNSRVFRVNATDVIRGTVCEPS